MDDRLYRKIRKAASFFSHIADPDDIAQEAALIFFEKGKTGKTCTQACIDAVRKHLGSIGTKRSQFEHALRTAKQVDTSFDDGGLAERLADPKYYDSREFEESRIDRDLVARSPYVEPVKHGVHESRISQLRRVEEERFIKAYLWEHYKEYGIDSEIEVDWIVI